MKQNQVFKVFLWGCVKDLVFVIPPPPVTLQELRGRITQAIAQIDENTLEKV
jgi:hypothetical protein